MSVALRPTPLLLSEAARRLNMTTYTFLRQVAKGKVQTIVEPGERVRYSAESVAKLATDLGITPGKAKK